MATIDDVREIAMALPGVTEATSSQAGGLAWRTKAGTVVWEREPGKKDLATLAEVGRTWPDGVVLGVRTDGEQSKNALIETYPDVFFTIPHFDGYPAVLVRLDAIMREQLAEVVTDAWLTRVPARVSSQWLAENGGDPEA